MRKSSSLTSKAGGGGPEKSRNKHNEEVEIDWEVRPCGLLVQKRAMATSTCAATGPIINLKVSHDSHLLHVSIPSQSTFGDLKRALAHETGLHPNDQRLLFRGKEKEDKECLHMAGVEEMSKILLLEDPASKERKIREMKQNRAFLKAYEAVSKVRAEVDKLSDKVFKLEKAVKNGMKIPDKEFIVLTELFMVQLLKLDSIETDGEVKMRRRIEVQRIQSFVDALDNLRERNSDPVSNRRRNPVSFTTKTDAFGQEAGSFTPLKPLQSSTTTFSKEWEVFD